MANEPLQQKIEKLKSTLSQLNSFPLPVETRAAIQSAMQAADTFSTDLKISQEQSRLAALYRVSYALGSSLDLDIVLTQVMDAVIGLTGAERGFLVLSEPGEEGWRLRAARNYSQETLTTKDMEVSRTVIGAVVRGGSGLVTTDAQTDPRFAQQQSVQFYSLRSIMCAPLLARSQVIGVIYVDNRAQVARFTEDDLQLLTAFAGQAAVAIENARLYTRTDQALAQRVTELETMAHIDRELSASLELNHTLQVTHHFAVAGVRADGGWAALAREEDVDRTTPLHWAGEKPNLEDPLATSAMETQTPQLTGGEDGTWRLAAPIVHTGKSLGVVMVVRRQAFNAAEVDYLTRLVVHAATAIENARLYQAVQQANQAKSKFVSVVTHELRIPMTSIKGYADLMRAGAVGPVNDMQLNFLNVIRNNVERMSALVSDLADISRIETGRFKLELCPLQVKDCIAEMLQNLRARINEKNQALELELTADLPLVYADPARVIQVLNNLVNNAIKYSPEGGKIRLAAHLEDRFVWVEVQDNGIGISEADQAQLFTQFFRSEDQAVRDQQGWGLGLNVARRLVELMGGTIGAYSALGKGSTFWFTLPVRS